MRAASVSWMWVAPVLGAGWLVLCSLVGCDGGWSGPPPGQGSTRSASSAGAEAPASAPAAEATAGPHQAASFDPMDERYEGRLEGGDPTLHDGTFYDAYAFDAARGATIVLVMRSDELEPYIHLIGPTGAQLAHGGRIEGEAAAEIVHVAPMDGTYQAYANTLDRTMRGAYELRVVVEPPPRPRTAGE